MENVGRGTVFDSLSGAVLACLQSAISLKKLKKQVETVYLNASQRVAGLRLFGRLMNKEVPHLFDLINWFCAALRGNTNALVHYLDDVRGCGKLLEAQARANFFQIVAGLLRKLVRSKDETEIRQILNALKWDYSANDHKHLNELKIFKVLRDGNKESEQLRALWGAHFKTEFLFKEPAAQGTVKSREQERREDVALLNKVALAKETLDLFEFVLVTSMGSSLRPREEGAKIKLKETSKLMPSLERIESVVDADATLQLLSQAYEIVFKELAAFVEFAQRFDGVNWKVYVRLMNRFRKVGAYFKEGNAALFEAVAAAEAEAVDDYNAEYNNEYNNDNYGNEYEGGWDVDPAEQEQTRLERLKEELELGKAQEFYNIAFTHKLLQLVNLIASVATGSAYASHVLFNIAHPQRIGTLVGVLCNGSPALKLLTVKVLEHLVLILPPELFEEAVKLMTSGVNAGSFQHQLLEKVTTRCALGSANAFTRLLFAYALAIRNKIWARKFESQGMYGVSSALLGLLRRMLENAVWRHLHEQELKDALQLVLELPFEERDALLALFGGELQGLAAGAVAADKNDNKITLLGFADQWIEDQEDQAKKNLKVPRTTMNFEAKTNKAVGLFINESAKDNNEVLILDPQELVLLEARRPPSQQLPIKDLLLERDLMLRLIREGIVLLSRDKSEKMSIEELNFKISVTKIVFGLIHEREEQFVDFLK